MCSQYSRTKGQVKVGKTKVAIKAPPQAIIRPTDRASVIRKGSGGLEEANLRWGLIPSWAKDPKIGVQCINARAETISEKPSFREAFQKRRCLVPADGFWEWEMIGKKKIPWKFARPDNEEFCMAGLWEAWNSPEGILETFTIITTSPNELVRSVHDRMPVILSQDEGEVWLEAGSQDLLRSAPDDFLIKTAEPNQVKEGCFDFMGSVSTV
jgi:putative SOS response-associated peptidase YedK